MTEPNQTPDLKKTLTDIETEFQVTLDFYQKYVFPMYDKAWKQYLKDGEDRRVNGRLKDWESNVYSSITQKFVDVMFANYYDSEIFIKVMGVDEQGKRGEKVLKRIFDEIFEKTKVRPQVDCMAKDSFVCGNGYIKGLWMKEDLTVSRFSKKGVKKDYLIRSVSLPSCKYVSNYHILPEPTCESVDSARYVYEIKFLNLQSRKMKLLNWRRYS